MLWNWTFVFLFLQTEDRTDGEETQVSESKTTEVNRSPHNSNHLHFQYVSVFGPFWVYSLALVVIVLLLHSIWRINTSISFSSLSFSYLSFSWLEARNTFTVKVFQTLRHLKRNHVDIRKYKSSSGDLFFFFLLLFDWFKNYVRERWSGPKLILHVSAVWC